MNDMQTIDAAEAAARLPDLLTALESGAEFTITREGMPIARLVGSPAPAETGHLATAIRRVQHLAEAHRPRLDAREIWVGGTRY
jgi:antitoxin (DNA-binding transcriptional repressor) of toxin-antitoxin stability system